MDWITGKEKIEDSDSMVKETGMLFRSDGKLIFKIPIQYFFCSKTQKYKLDFAFESDSKQFVYRACEGNSKCADNYIPIFYNCNLFLLYVSVWLFCWFN